MIPERLRLAQQYLADAQYLLAADRLASAVSRAYYAAYQAMWAALGDPPRAAGWRHGAMINHFVRGVWCAPTYPLTGPGLLEPLRFGLRRLYELRLDGDYDGVPISRASAEAGVQNCAPHARRNQPTYPRRAPMSAVEPREKRLAEAVAVLVEAIHHDVPTASTRPLAPYDDEDFTLEVRIPAGMDRDAVMDLCIRHALAVEDEFGFMILTRVKVAAAPEANACSDHSAQK